MKKVKANKSLLVWVFIGLAAICSIGLASCNSKQTKDAEVKEKPLNITVYLDLSDRLQRDMLPTQKDRDIAIVGHFIKLFTDSCLQTGILNSRHHFKVLFYPSPKDSEIAVLASSLDVDMAKIEAKEKRVTLKRMPNDFKKSLTQIYDETLKAQDWIGSDVWGFFSNKKVDELCMRNGYRNILVILSDGYLYYEPNKQQEGNSYSYVLPKTLSDASSSLIVKRKGLQNLEVLMLETNPYTPLQHDKLQSVLDNWFKGMETGRFVVSETDMPTNTAVVIDNFLTKY